MSKVTDLQDLIQQQEDEAAKLNHADTSGDYYKNLYELLSVAFFAAKDLIVLQQGNVTVEPDKALEAKLCDAEALIKTQTAELEYLKGSLDRVREIVG